MAVVPFGGRLLDRLFSSIFGQLNRTFSHKTFILILTFFAYTSYHLSRKPIGVVKGVLYRNCSVPINNNPFPVVNASDAINGTCWCCWSPFDNDKDAEALLGSLDYAYLFAYAFGMFVSGHIAERMDLRYFLTGGMLLSGLFTAAVGFAYFWEIHSFAYFLIIQIIGGMFQATGWPAVVAIIANWFGKGKRGLIMGIWNSHTSVGNILGSIVAGYFVDTAWGWSFLVPGFIIGGMGIIIFIFLISYPTDVGCTPPEHVKPGEFRNGKASEYDIDPSKQPAISIWKALWIPGVVEFSLCLFFAKLVSYTFLFWLPYYIDNTTDKITDQQAAYLSTLFDVGGIAGGIAAGFLADVSGASGTISFLMLIIAAPLVYLYNAYGYLSLEISISLMMISGFFVNGPYALITTAVSADLGTHPSLQGNARALATVTAIIDGTGTIGAAIGPLITGLIDPKGRTGWNNVFMFLVASELVGALLISRQVYKDFLKKCRRPRDAMLIQSQDSEREPLIS
ncbi:glucose-6-phosphate exchanger SLC37A2-like isoform X2 [Amphiura filiformis]|uniref:glucose-6-phosphate exchanger SLC37A2-like isoform X2 n=1 Tax=Amphiura filiformis TaxID=82378 RepID=UPI003B21FBBA